MIQKMKMGLRASFLFAAVGLLAAPVFGQAQSPAPAASSSLSSVYQNPIPGVTTPLQEQYAKLTLAQSGQILKVTVKPGDTVKQGQLLVQQDDRAEIAKLKGFQLEANSTAKVDEAKANLEVKKSVLARKEKTHKENALSAQELEEARLEAIDAEARLKVSELDLAKAKTDVEFQQARIEQMKLIAPFEGMVESVQVGIGENADPTKPMITVVQTNPLWVEVRNMPTIWAGRLKVGDKVEVRYDERYAGTPIYDGKWVQAQVTYKSPVADERSDTQLVRLAMPNPNHLDAGLQVVVKLPESVVNPAASPAASAAGK
ncbi:MAG TPA: efflux RND transporter periplasmic adaptor subunit [Tepidisphaeraceae bacterium]|jgi:RND family efflux transporter MFP subunit